MSDSFVTPWTISHQAPLSMGFSRQEYWSGLSLPPSGDLPNPGIEPASLASPAWQVDSFTEPPGKPLICFRKKLTSLNHTFLPLCIYTEMTDQQLNGLVPSLLKSNTVMLVSAEICFLLIMLVVRLFQRARKKLINVI